MAMFSYDPLQDEISLTPKESWWTKVITALENIYDSGELDKVSNLQNLFNKREIEMLSARNLNITIWMLLQLVIDKSVRLINSRIWATKTLKEFIIKGLFDDERLSPNDSIEFVQWHWDPCITPVSQSLIQQVSTRQDLEDDDLLSGAYPSECIKKENLLRLWIVAMIR